MTSTFQSNDKEVSDILRSIATGSTQLPDFQRGWVWDDIRIRGVIASISNGFPVGALMFLAYGGDNIRFKYRPFTGSNGTDTPDALVLDGQQRLTTIFTAMFCKNAVSTTKDAYSKKEIWRYYYLDIQKCLDDDTDRIDAVVSVPENRQITENIGRDVVLDLSSQEKEFTAHYFPCNIIYDREQTDEWFEKYRDHWGDKETNREFTRRLDKFNREVLQPIYSYKVPVITLLKGVSKEAVCKVFENVNTGGVSLTMFELLTAMFAADDFQLRNDWEKQEKAMKEKSPLLADVASTDYLTAITLLSQYRDFVNGERQSVGCTRKDVLKLPLEEYKKYSDEITNGFLQSANFLTEQRVFQDIGLPYTTIRIPLAVLFAVNNDTKRNDSIRQKIAQWFWCAVLGEMYGGSTESIYTRDVRELCDWFNGKQEPRTITGAVFSPMRLLGLTTRGSAAYKGIMALVLKEKPMDFISGKEIDLSLFAAEKIDIHHIFPQAYCDGQNYEERKWNSVVNKTPLSASSNRAIGGDAPSKYLKKIINKGQVQTDARLDEIVVSHGVNAQDLRVDNFDDYFVKRAKYLLKLIQSAMGKTIQGLDSEEVIAAFGGKLCD